MKKIHLDVIQYFSGVLVAIAGGIAGLLVGIVSMANSGLVVGYLPGYEAGGVLGGAAGIWIGSLFGIMLAAKLSRTDGSFLWATVFSLIGSVGMLAAVSWQVPIIDSPVLLLVVVALAYVGWNLPNWRQR